MQEEINRAERENERSVRNCVGNRKYNKLLFNLIDKSAVRRKSVNKDRGETDESMDNIDENINKVKRRSEGMEIKRKRKKKKKTKKNKKKIHEKRTDTRKNNEIDRQG